MPTLTSTQTRSANDVPLYVPTDGSGGVVIPGSLTVLGPTSLVGGPVTVGTVAANVTLGINGGLRVGDGVNPRGIDVPNGSIQATGLRALDRAVAVSGFIGGSTTAPSVALFPSGISTTGRIFQSTTGTSVAPVPAPSTDNTPLTTTCGYFALSNPNSGNAYSANFINASWTTQTALMVQLCSIFLESSTGGVFVPASVSAGRNSPDGTSFNVSVVFPTGAVPPGPPGSPVIIFVQVIN